MWGLFHSPWQTLRIPSPTTPLNQHTSLRPRPFKGTDQEVPVTSQRYARRCETFFQEYFVKRRAKPANSTHEPLAAEKKVAVSTDPGARSQTRERSRGMCTSRGPGRLLKSKPCGKHIAPFVWLIGSVWGLRKNTKKEWCKKIFLSPHTLWFPEFSPACTSLYNAVLLFLIPKIPRNGRTSPVLLHIGPP